MFKKLQLKNYKSARDLEIPLGALTVLSGLNGSGKSSVLQAIALLRQSINGENHQIQSLHLRGPLVQLGQGKDILSERASSENITVRLASDQSSIEVIATSSGDLDVLPVTSTPTIQDSESAHNLKSCWFQYIQADRLVPRTHYERGDSNIEESQFLGTHGEFTPAFLAKYGEKIEVSSLRWADGQNKQTNADSTSSSSNPPPPKLNNHIVAWLQQLSPGVTFRADHLQGTDLTSLRFSYFSDTIGLNSGYRRPANVGFGLTYCLPIVTALLAAPAGGLLLLENPEAHLHPRGQAALGGLLVMCARDGVQIVVETHSDHVLNGIRIAAKYSPEDPQELISICNFTRDPKTGDSYIEAPKILKNGELTAWPDGFFDEWEKSLEILLKS